MALYSQLDQNNKVVYIMFIEDQTITDENDIISDELFIQHMSTHHHNDFEENSRWVRSPYLREEDIDPKIRTYATSSATPKIGWTYNETTNLFDPKIPYDSWIYDESIRYWKAPIELPDQINDYAWDEDVYKADNTKGWILLTLPPNII